MSASSPSPRRPSMIRPFRLFATLAATLALALGVTARLVRAEPDAAPAVAYQGAIPVHARADEGGEYRLDRLPILSKVILSVKDNYVDPSRFDPKRMVVAALESVEKTVAEVMVQGDAKSPKLTLTVGASTPRARPRRAWTRSGRSGPCSARRWGSSRSTSSRTRT